MKRKPAWNKRIGLWLTWKLKTELTLEEMDAIAKQVGIDMSAPAITPEQVDLFEQGCKRKAQCR